jgi:hypothetical protein
LVLLLAVVGYWTLFQTTGSDPKRLSTLVIESPGVAGLEKPTSSQVVPPTQTTWSAFKKAAKTDPDQTGGFSKTWQAAKSSTSSLSVLVAYLPAASNATRLRNQVFADYTNAKNLKADDIAITSRFTLAGVPDSQGVSYQESASSSNGAAKGSTVVFSAGRVVAVVYGTSSTDGSSDHDVRSVVREESALLQTRLPGFSMSEWTTSAFASMIYVLIALSVAGAAFVLPGVVQRERARRHTRQAARLSYGRQVRGSKVLRRHAMSPILQVNRRSPARPGKSWSKR